LLLGEGLVVLLLLHLGRMRRVHRHGTLIRFEPLLKVVTIAWDKVVGHEGEGGKRAGGQAQEKGVSRWVSEIEARKARKRSDRRGRNKGQGPVA
jgi:hypothetical protein